MSRTALSSHHSRLTVFAESLAFDDDDYELTSHAHREHTRELPSFTHSACSRSAVRESTCACVAVECRKLSRQTLLSRRLGSSTSPPCSLCFLSLSAPKGQVFVYVFTAFVVAKLWSLLSLGFSLSLCVPLGRSRRSRSFAVGFKWQCKINWVSAAASVVDVGFGCDVSCLAVVVVACLQLKTVEQRCCQLSNYPVNKYIGNTNEHRNRSQSHRKNNSQAAGSMQHAASSIITLTTNPNNCTENSCISYCSNNKNNKSIS